MANVGVVCSPCWTTFNRPRSFFLFADFADLPFAPGTRSSAPGRKPRAMEIGCSLLTLARSAYLLLCRRSAKYRHAHTGGEMPSPSRISCAIDGDGDSKWKTAKQLENAEVGVDLCSSFNLGSSQPQVRLIDCRRRHSSWQAELQLRIPGGVTGRAWLGCPGCPEAGALVGAGSVWPPHRGWCMAATGPQTPERLITPRLEEEPQAPSSPLARFHNAGALRNPAGCGQWRRPAPVGLLRHGFHQHLGAGCFHAMRLRSPGAGRAHAPLRLHGLNHPAHQSEVVMAQTASHPSGLRLISWHPGRRLASLGARSAMGRQHRHHRWGYTPF